MGLWGVGLLASLLAFPVQAGDSPLVVGQPPPALALQDLDGNTVSLDSVRGSIVVLDFWASWCGPCRIELPLLSAMQDQHRDAGLKVLAVNVDTETSLRDAFLARNPVQLTILDDSSQATIAAYQVEKMPTTVVVDREGKVHAVHYGFDKASFAALRGEVDALLKTE